MKFPIVKLFQIKAEMYFGIGRLVFLQLNSFITTESFPFVKSNLLSFQAARGKFMDTSHRIFNEQRVQKSHLYYEPAIAMSAMSDVNEFTPLKMKVNNENLAKFFFAV